MSDETLTLNAVLNACGGKDAVARERKIGLDAIKKWHRGIPPKHWAALSRMSGGQISLDDLAGMSASGGAAE